MGHRRHHNNTALGSTKRGVRKREVERIAERVLGKPRPLTPEEQAWALETIDLYRREKALRGEPCP